MVGVEDDWRLTNQRDYLMAAVVVLQSWAASRHGSDHAHCEFCWLKFGVGGEADIGYCTGAESERWICKSCFGDFRDELKLVEPADLIGSALTEVEQLMATAFENLDGDPKPESPLSQIGLVDGGLIVRDYLAHGEVGLAWDHLVYMIRESRLRISVATDDSLRRAGQVMRMDLAEWPDANDEASQHPG